MTARLVTVLVVSVLITVPPAAAQEGGDDPAALVAAAIEAHGGEELLGRWSNLSLEGKAKISWGPMEMQADSKLHVRHGVMMRQEASMTMRGTPMSFAQASTGKSAWRQFRSRVYDHPTDDLATWLSHRPDILLRAAEAPAGTLAAGGSAEVDDDPVDVVELSVDGATTRILIDRESRLVRALEYRAEENAGEGKKEDVFLRKTYGDYRDVEGIPFPHHRVEFREGVETINLEVASVELGVEPDLALFARPIEDEEVWEWPDQIAN
jgi:hypothetical protein